MENLRREERNTSVTVARIELCPSVVRCATPDRLE
jgi:hypothetical protein